MVQIWTEKFFPFCKGKINHGRLVVIGDAEAMLMQHFYQASLPGFGKDRETHVHWEWCFSVFGVSVCCCSLFVSGIAVILQQLGNGLVRL